MSGDVILSAGVRANLLALQNTAELITRTETRLATGKKVNSALDNPYNFFVASGYQTRAGDLSALLDQMSNAVKTLEAADAGLTAIKGLVETAKGVANSALASDVTTATLTGTVSGLTAATSFAVSSGKTITFSDGTTTGVFTTTGATTTVQQLIDGINAFAGFRGKAILTGGGSIQIQATTTNALTITASTFTAPELAQFGLVVGQTAAAGTLNANRTALQAQFDNIRTQITSLAQDTMFNGQALLNGDGLTVKFNETGTSLLTITGVSSTAAGLGLLAVTNSFQTDWDVNNALAQVQAALNTLRTQASTLSSHTGVIKNRESFNEALINTLKTGADNLVVADTNEEGANMLVLQTRQQLSQTALSLAAQADQSVLRLFQ
jgi:flagellin